MEYAKTAFNDSVPLDEEKQPRGSMEKRKHVDLADEDDKFKSKNLEAERRRRKKLNDRILELRSLVPIITNMNKGTVITDAVTYIEELKRHVEHLSDQLLQMDANCIKEEATTKSKEINSAEEMNTWGIQPEIQVTSIDGTKIWIKIVYPKTKSGFTKIMEAISVLGFDLTDISATTTKGAILFTSCLEGTRGGLPDVNQIKALFSEIVKSI